MTPLDQIHDALAAAGCNPKHRGHKLESRCPAHDDHHPSLSVAIGTRRDIVIHCHAGCSPAAIMAALKMRWTDLGEPSPPSSSWEKEYRYHDRDGTLVGAVRRYPGKQFRQYRTDHGELIPGLNGMKLPIFRWPQIVDAITRHETIWIVEGEKDVLALAAAGVTATCNPGGAGKWLSSHTAAVLDAKSIIIVADRDGPGIAHAAAVKESLHDHNYTAPIRLVQALKGKDAADHIAAGCTIEMFVDIQPDNTANPETDDTPFVDFTKLWDDEPDEEEWALYPFVPAGRAVSFFAGAKQGKSTLLLAGIAGMVTGQPVYGGEIQTPKNVLYLDYEMTRADLRDRLTELGYGPQHDWTHLYYALLPQLPPLESVEGAQAVLDLTSSCAAEVVVIDTYGRAVVGEENSADTTRAFYRHTGSALKRAGIAWVRVDHSGKDPDKGPRGSSAKNEDVDLVWHLTRVDGHSTLTRTHTRIGWGPSKVEIDRREDEDGIVTYTIAKDGYPAGTERIVAALNDLDVPVTAGRRVAQKALRDAGIKAKSTLIDAALKARREAPKCGKNGGTQPGTQPPTDTSGHNLGHIGTQPANPQVTGRTQPGTHRDTTWEGDVSQMCPPIGGHMDTPVSQADLSAYDPDLI